MLPIKLPARSLIKQSLRSKVGFSTSVNKKDENTFGKIKSWQIHSYGGVNELQLTDARKPIIKDPNDVIVKVSASSVNPIDVAMMSGYGSVFLNFMRQAKSCSLEKNIEFPLTLGRDFSGVVIEKGYDVTEYSIDDEVWGVVPISDQGAHAEQVLVSKSCIRPKPKSLSMTDAGSILYAAVTAWSALKITGELALFETTGKTVLVLGASGGVGTMAVQMLLNWGVHVVATCSTDAIPLLESLGVIDIVDYKAQDAFDKIQKFRYDIILDCAGIGQDNANMYLKYLKDYKLAKYITLRSPMLKNFDEYGMLAGLAKNAADLLSVNFIAGILPKTSSIRWGFFIPLESALSEITHDVSNQKILPVVQKVYKFNELPAAYEHVQTGHLRGKIVIDVSAR